MDRRFLTIGHSTHTIDRFIDLVRNAEVTAIADVRSTPSSRFTPQFNRDALRRSLDAVGVGYVFLGAELGARSPDPDCYVDGVVQYDRLASSDAFKSGIERLLTGIEREQIALLCTEQDPLDCHRTVLVSRVLRERGADVGHIRSDGEIESHDDAMERLLVSFGLDQPDLLHTHDELVGEALERQERRIAYVAKDQATG